MELIFFHAGESKEKTDKTGSKVRLLTKRAERLTADAAEGIYRLRPRKTKMEVWSNIEPHMAQSAQIIAEELGIKAKIVNAIGQDDFRAVLKMISEPAKEKCILIVGEHPYLCLWADQLTGLKLTMSHYSAAGFVVDPQECAATDFLWYASEPTLKRIR